MLSDDELSFSDSSLEEDYLEDSMIYDDDEEPECTCGAEGRGHKRDCPLNPHYLYQAKPATSTPVRPPTSAPRKRSSLQVHVFPPSQERQTLGFMQYHAECESIGRVLQSRLFFVSRRGRILQLPRKR